MNPNHINVGVSSTYDALHRSPGVVKNRQGCRASPECDVPYRRPDVVLNRQGFPHRGRMWVKKLVQSVDVTKSQSRGGNRQTYRKGDMKLSMERKVRVGTWNIGSLTGKLMELVDTMSRRRVNIACIQKTKWVGEKSKEIGNTSSRLWYSGQERNRNGVGIILDRSLKESVVAVKRVGDRIILVKLVVEGEAINVISAYAPQIGLDSECKEKFWENIDKLMQSVSSEESIFIGGDLNGHVGKDRQGYEMVHGGFGYGSRNEE
ncbi:PREDICTED: uncharacterized protein LOC104799692 [Tarenaya hassleriana]|uniref:uncharacterized protein LOC104799692 n=1 Tax=Tarenaya hassleriana TaxID=28532 RepID=UPI00053C456B|nr:PREDICTED: uncharacterized protein LOC104799692 [Tarenaya hassleriana]